MPAGSRKHAKTDATRKLEEKNYTKNNNNKVGNKKNTVAAMLAGSAVEAHCWPVSLFHSARQANALLWAKCDAAACLAAH